MTRAEDACAAYGVQLPRRRELRNAQHDRRECHARARPAGANNWWVEFSISGSVASASLEVVGGGTISLSTQWGKWAGSTPKIATGTSVVLRAVDTSGRAARTAPFRYLVDAAPTTFGGFRLVRNADGNGLRFADTAVRVEHPEKVPSSLRTRIRPTPPRRR
ncbi:MAG: hypothetical protein U0270_30135 [Labilithrix sp.]